jgi:hypothetical protein
VARILWDREEERRMEVLHSEEVLRAAGLQGGREEKKEGREERGEAEGEQGTIRILTQGEEAEEEAGGAAREFEERGQLTRDMLQERREKRNKMGASFDWGGGVGAQAALTELQRLEQLATQPLEQLADALADKKRVSSSHNNMQYVV